MKPIRAHRARWQRGAALLALAALLVVGGLWFLLSALNAPINSTPANQKHNAKVLSQAKSALIGYVAQQAASSTENDPGALPCPEAAGYIGSPSDEGKAAGNCTLPAVGRLPWRTLGLDKPRDAGGEPLWYVVSTGWAKPNSTTNTVINSNSTGQLTLDGTADVVALIIAPGHPLPVQASANCTARNQTRSVPSSTIDFRDYLECQNATSPADASFASSGPQGSFNDQVLSLTAAELLPSVEAAVASRFEVQIAPVMRTVYSSASWGGSPILPFAQSFGNPATAASYMASRALMGLLPLSYSETAPNSGSPCAPGVAEPRCQPLFVAWTGGSISGPQILSPSCTVVTTTHTRLDCTFRYIKNIFAPPPASISFTLQAQAANAGAALRQFNTAVAMTNVNAAGRTASGTLSSTGAATVTLSGSTPPADASLGLIGDLLCGLTTLLQALNNDCYSQTISVPIFLLADHPLVDANNITYGWFLRNKWHEVSYYALAGGHAPGGAGSCTTSSTCLQVTYHPQNGKQRALLLFSGRSLTATTRPNGTLADWLEGSNSDGVSPFAVRSPSLAINRTFNDRIAVVDSNP